MFLHLHKTSNYVHNVYTKSDKIKKEPFLGFLINHLSGERGIRTPGASQHAGFQDRCNRPLYHLSELS